MYLRQYIIQSGKVGREHIVSSKTHQWWKIQHVIML